TLALAETGADVVAIEMDRHLLPALRSVVEPAGVRVVQADALRLDWEAVLAPPGASGHTPPAVEGVTPEGPGTGGPEHRRPWVLVGNLPYNIATPLVLDVLARAPQIDRLLVMVQRE